MNQVSVQLNAFSVREEMPTAAAAADRRERVVCPKPRRLGLIKTPVNDNPFRHNFDSLAANDALDLLFFKGGCGSENFNSSPPPPPPYLCGSPPSRVANPLIQDARFGDKSHKVVPIFSSAAVGAPPPSSTPPHTAGRKGGCVRSTFCNNPAVRIEGFDCRLDREMQNRSIPALG